MRFLPRRALSIWFVVVVAVLLWATVTASRDRNVLVAAAELWRDPWGKATLLDAYFAFAVVWLWIAYREGTWLRRVVWAVAIAGLGNFAIAGYLLWALHRLPPQSGFAGLLLRPEDRP